MHRSTLTVIIAGVLSGLGSPTASAGEPSAFDRIEGHYEAIRQALLQDTTEGVASSAGQIERELTALESDLDLRATGIRGDAADQLRELLPAARIATGGLRATADIEDARGSFGELSEAMVRYRQLVPDPRPVVVFCPMAQKVWLQPKGEIGNPYYGQSMARCGEVVAE
jgi:hypothetical protein